MTTAVKKIYTDGRVEEGQWKMSLKEMQEFVGGFIEQVPSTVPHRALIVNEEGLLNDLPQNFKATLLANPRTAIIGAIRGNALLIKR